MHEEHVKAMVNQCSVARLLGIEIYEDTPLGAQYTPEFDPQRDTMELNLGGIQIWRKGQ